VSFSLPQESLQKIARVGRVGEDPLEEVGVGVTERELNMHGRSDVDPISTTVSLVVHVNS